MPIDFDCERCGIGFDSTESQDGSHCEDCYEEVMMEEWEDDMRADGVDV